MQLQTENSTYISLPPPPIESFVPGTEGVLGSYVHQAKSNSPEVLADYLQALSYEKKGDRRSEVEVLENVIGRLPSDNKVALAKVHYLIAVCYYELGEREKTLENFEKAAKLWPDNYEIYLGLAMEYLLSGKIHKAIQTYKAAIKFNKKRSEAYFYLGYIYSKQHQWELAIKHYKKAINVDKNFKQTYIHLAHLYFDLGEKSSDKRDSLFGEAIKVYTDLLKIEPNASGVYNNIGVIYSFLGRYEEALNAYQKAIELDTSNELARKNLFSLKNNRLNDKQLLERITLNPKVMTGKPVIKGTRLTVEYILNLLAHGATEEEILNEYEGLTKEDIHACFLFATKSLGNTAFLPLTVETV
jgi:tetratricopeptide (TPR) repeat protein